jgi:hypothetical protein
MVIELSGMIMPLLSSNLDVDGELNTKNDKIDIVTIAIFIKYKIRLGYF